MSPLLLSSIVVAKNNATEDSVIDLVNYPRPTMMTLKTSEDIVIDGVIDDNERKMLMEIIGGLQNEEE